MRCILECSTLSTFDRVKKMLLFSLTRATAALQLRKGDSALPFARCYPPPRSTPRNLSLRCVAFKQSAEVETQGRSQTASTQADELRALEADLQPCSVEETILIEGELVVGGGWLPAALPLANQSAPPYITRPAALPSCHLLPRRLWMGELPRPRLVAAAGSAGSRDGGAGRYAHLAAAA